MRQTTARIRCDSLRDVEPSDHVLWQKVKIREIGKVVTGMTPPTKHQAYYGDDYLFVTPSDLDFDSYIVSKTERCISKQGYEKYSNRFIPAMSTMYTCIGSTIGKIGLCRETVLTNQQINSIIPNDVHDAKFVYYLMRSQTNEIRALNAGCAVPIINKGDFENIDVHLPPLPVQRRIADILSAYDDLIENNRRRIAILEETARLTYRKWFNENSSLTASVRIGEFIELQNGFAFKSNTFVEAGQYKIITIKNVKDVIVDSGNVAFVNRIPERMPIHCRIHPRDILLSLTGNVGRVSIAIDHDGLLNQRVAKVKSDFPWCSLLFLTSNESFSLMNNLAVGAAQQNLSPVKLCDEFVEMPIRVKMAQIEKLVAPLFDQIVLLAQQNTALAAARDMLLPRLMKGQPCFSSL